MFSADNQIKFKNAVDNERLEMLKANQMDEYLKSFKELFPQVNQLTSYDLG